MGWVIILAVIAAAALALISLARGLYYFSLGHRAGADGSAADNLKKQNQMMVARIKWQAIAVIFLVVLAVMAAGSKGG